MSDELNTVGKRLKYFRISKKLSQEVLEAKSDVHRSLISRYERGLDTPTKKTIKRLSKALKIDENAFFSTPILNISGSQKDHQLSLLFDKKEFAKRLKILRAKKGISQVELARKSKIYHGQIAKYEREHSTPSLDNCILLADSLGITIDFLLRGSNSNSSKECNLDSSIIELLSQLKNCTINEKESVELMLLGLLNGFKNLNKAS